MKLFAMSLIFISQHVTTGHMPYFAQFPRPKRQALSSISNTTEKQLRQKLLQPSIYNRNYRPVKNKVNTSTPVRVALYFNQIEKIVPFWNNIPTLTYFTLILFLKHILIY